MANLKGADSIDKYHIELVLTIVCRRLRLRLLRSGPRDNNIVCPVIVILLIFVDEHFIIRDLRRGPHNQLGISSIEVRRKHFRCSSVQRKAAMKRGGQRLTLSIEGKNSAPTH